MSKSGSHPRQVRSVHGSLGRHWVGDGFPVQTVFAYPELGAELSPFLLLDYAAPMSFSKTTARRGVGPHPHRGFETVTIVFDGQVEHRDSSGGGGTIGKGDVQWMTAGAGIVHEEFHGRDFAREGGVFEVAQLWVNLPAAHKRTPARYQGITSASIPDLALPDDRGRVHVIAGSFDGNRGPAHTFTPINLWWLDVTSNQPITLPLPASHGAAVVALRGSGRIESQPITDAQVAILERDGDGVVIERAQGLRALVLTGESIDEPIVGSGPFVMNTAEEIALAYADFRSGRMGSLDESK